MNRIDDVSILVQNWARLHILVQLGLCFMLIQIPWRKNLLSQAIFLLYLIVI